MDDWHEAVAQRATSASYETWSSERQIDKVHLTENWLTTEEIRRMKPSQTLAMRIYGSGEAFNDQDGEGYDANYVPGALESSGELGISALFPEWNAAVRVRYLGPHALIEDNSQRGEAATTVNFRAAWTPTSLKGFEIYGELLNVFDMHGHDIDYYYETRFPGEPADGVADLNSRIAEPRQVRIGIKKTF